MGTAPSASALKAREMVKALRFTKSDSIDAITYEALAIDEPGFQQVLVDIRAASLNYRDLFILRGHYLPATKRPLIPGSEGAGRVIKVGRGVTRFKVGDRVIGSFFQNWIDGPFRDEFGHAALGVSVDGVLTTARLFDEASLVHLPSHLSYEEGATLPCSAVSAWHALVSTSHIKSGDVVLMLGIGGTTVFGLQFAKLHGARVIMASNSDDKLSRARALGADETINYQKCIDWPKEVLSLTHGQGADIVLEYGPIHTLGQSLRAVRPYGNVSLVSGGVTGINQPLNAPLVIENVRVREVDSGSVAMFNDMNRVIAANRLTPVIDHVFPIEQICKALYYLDTGKHFGKVVISIQ